MSKEERARKMLALVEQWQQSGESRQAFAAAHQINNHTFQYWISKKQKAHRSNSGFVQLNGITGTNISLRYRNGVELLLPSSIPVSMLKELINL